MFFGRQGLFTLFRTNFVLLPSTTLARLGEFINPFNDEAVYHIPSANVFLSLRSDIVYRMPRLLDNLKAGLHVK